MCCVKVSTEELERMEYEVLCQVRDMVVLYDEMLTKLGYESISLLEVKEEIEVHLEP